MCDRFMEYMLPSKPDNTTNHHIYDIPYVWNIEYYRKTEKNTFLTQPNQCALKDVQIKYNSGHTYNSGAPLEVELSLTFIEIEPLYRTSSPTTDSSGSGVNKRKGNKFTPMNVSEDDLRSPF